MMIRGIFWMFLWLLSLGTLHGKIKYKDGLTITLKKARIWRGESDG